APSGIPASWWNDPSQREVASMFLTRGARARGAMARGRRVVPFPASALLVLAAAVACARAAPAAALPQVALEPLNAGFTQPVHIANAPGFPQHLWIVEQTGTIKIYDLEAGALRPEPFLSVSSLVSRSEEHTSELQSRENLVCRLLLE